jgi:hypothetical protein
VKHVKLHSICHRFHLYVSSCGDLRIDRWAPNADPVAHTATCVFVGSGIRMNYQRELGVALAPLLMIHFWLQNTDHSLQTHHFGNVQRLEVFAILKQNI